MLPVPSFNPFFWSSPDGCCAEGSVWGKHTCFPFGKFLFRPQQGRNALFHGSKLPLSSNLDGVIEAVRQPLYCPTLSFSALRRAQGRLREERNCHPEFRLGGTKDLEILRLTPQNDLVGQPPFVRFELHLVLREL